MIKKMLPLLLITTLLTRIAYAEAMPDYLSKIIPVGNSNTIAGEHFTGKSFLYPLSTKQVGIFNVTFEPGCYNEWHIHHASKGGGQILIAISGRGWYQ